MHCEMATLDQPVSEMSTREMSSSEDIQTNNTITNRQGAVQVTGSAGLYQCNVCGKQTTSESYLKQHSARHNTGRAFPCAEPGCRYSGKCISALKSHMITHSKVMMFKCSQCPYQCRRGSQLQSHLFYNHSPQRPHACPLCPKRFATQQEYDRHYNFRHPGGYQPQDTASNTAPPNTSVPT